MGIRKRQTAENRKEALKNNDLEIAIDAFKSSGDIKNPDISNEIVAKMMKLKESSDTEDKKRLIALAEKIRTTNQ